MTRNQKRIKRMKRTLRTFVRKQKLENARNHHNGEKID